MQGKSVRIGLIGATLETTNMGVGALAAGAIQCLLSGCPGAEIRILEYAKSPSVQKLRTKEGELQVPVINIRFSKRFYLKNNIAFLLLVAMLAKLCVAKRLRDWVLHLNATLREMQQMDFVASIAGGDSFSDIYGMERLLYVALPQILVILIGRKLVLLPQTLGPFRGNFSKMVARFILRKAIRVYARDHQSLEDVQHLLGDAGRASKFAFCHDVGFLLEPIAPDHIDTAGLHFSQDKGRLLVGLNVSGLLFKGGYTGKNMFDLRADYKELVRASIEYLIKAQAADVLLIPHVFGTDPNSESDSVACESVYDQLKEKYPGRLGVLRGFYNQNQIKHVIGKCDFFIGARMHACIAAVSQCVPSVCVAYSDKFIGVMKTIGIESNVADARKLDTPGVITVVEQSFENRHAIRQQLEQRIPAVRSSTLEMGFNLLHSPTVGALIAPASADRTMATTVKSDRES
jgi:colanic acid/amylovoran biosynthesis protein